VRSRWSEGGTDDKFDEFLQVVPRQRPTGQRRPAPHREQPDEQRPATRAYRDALLAKGWTKKAVYRALKRAVAREVFRALSGHCSVPDYTDPRPARRAKNITLTTMVEHLNVWPARIGELELGGGDDDQLADRYREWLTAA